MTTPPANYHINSLSEASIFQGEMFSDPFDPHASPSSSSPSPLEQHRTSFVRNDDDNDRRHNGENEGNINIASVGNFFSDSSQQKSDHDSLTWRSDPTEFQSFHTQPAQITTPITIPRSFYCPLTLSPMIDPVIDLEGNSYERSAILHYLVHMGHDTSPITRNPLKPFHLAVNRALKELIHEFMGPDWTKHAEEQIIKHNLQHSHIANNNSSTHNKNDKNTPNSNRENCNENKIQKQPKLRIKHTSRYRNLVDSFLLEISRSTPLDEQLNEAGVCAFAYDSHRFVIEVPEHSGLYLFYTSLGKLEEVRAKHLHPSFAHQGQQGGSSSFRTNENGKDILKTLLQWNYLQKQTRGGVLSLDPMADGENDIHFSYYGQVEDVNCADFRTELERFVETSLRLYDKLHREEEVTESGGVLRKKVDFGFRVFEDEDRRNSI